MRGHQPRLFWLGAAIAGVGLASKLIGGRKRRPNNAKAIAALRAARPTGYLTPEDYRASELTRGRLAEGARGQGQLAGYEVSRRARARGLAGSPSEERSQARIGQQTALGIQHAGESAEEQLYNTRTGRERFQQQAELDIFGAEAGATQREQARQDAQQGAFWNSLNEFTNTIMPYLSPTTDTTGTTAVTGYNPAGPSIPRPGPAPF